MTTRWKPVHGYEDLYQVSDVGGVRSQRCVLKPRRNRRGYLYVNLYRGGQARTFQVHRVVLDAFVGPRQIGQECRHLDGDRLNNRLDNLTWGTPSENRLDQVKHRTHHNTVKSKCPQGHRYDMYSGGRRRCRTCHNATSRAGSARRRRLREGAA